MSENFKKVMANSFVMAILFIALGVVLVVNPELSAIVMCDILAVVLLVLGIVKVFMFIRTRVREVGNRDLAVGTFFVALAILIFVFPERISAFIPSILAIFLIFGGADKLQDGVELRREGYSHWGITIIMALVVAGLGFLVYFNPFSSATLFMRIIGLSLIVEGAVYLIVALMAKDPGRVRNESEEVLVIEDKERKLIKKKDPDADAFDE
ncbi:MAG: DUF308 domain-containing protein [Lachnospiraceae bacterium]|nr:DUF308 domain-containing protein [Lachnospiraceae bacterium]